MRDCVCPSWGRFGIAAGGERRDSSVGGTLAWALPHTLSAGCVPAPQTDTRGFLPPRESFLSTCLQAGGAVRFHGNCTSGGSGSQMRTGASPRLPLSSDPPLGSQWTT